MVIPGFIAGQPQDGQSLGNSKPIIRNNLDGTFQTVSVDHQNQNLPNPGYHSVIHFQNQGSNPTDTPGSGQLFTLTSGSVPTQNLYYKIGGVSPPVQMTSLFNPSATTNGQTFLPGGILMQWGQFSVPALAGSISFNHSFSAPPFMIQVTLQITSPGSTPNPVVVNGTAGNLPTALGFKYIIGNSNIGANSIIHWLAIGF